MHRVPQMREVLICIQNTLFVVMQLKKGVVPLSYHARLHIRPIYTNLIAWILTILHNLQVIIQSITQEGCISPKINAKWEWILQLIEQLIFCVTGKWTTEKSSLIFRFCNFKTLTKHFYNYSHHLVCTGNYIMMTTKLHMKESCQINISLL